MGLDVKVYKNIKLIDSYEEDYDFKAYVIDQSWEYKIKNLVKNGNYKGDLAYYEISYPYSSHNRFRESLITLIGRSDLLDSNGAIKWELLSPDIPFYDFINFADNEGCLDWEISAKIFDDFFKFKDKVQQDIKYNSYTYSLIRNG